MMRRLNVVLTAAAAVTLSAAPLSAQWGIFGRNSSSNRVPAGHMPSRGMCRVWIDGVPAGHQPRQTDCRTAERQRPYYEERYRRNARVIYGDRSNGRYDTRNSSVIFGRGNGGVYDDRNGTNCRYVERVVAGRVIRQRVCDNNGGVYGDRVYDRNGNVIYRRDGVYRDSRGRVVHRDSRGVYRDSRGRIYDRRRNDRDSDSDGRGRGKNKNKHRGRW
ncbi:MAG: hypothetical protein M3303_09990 [Gemmatimonadota bacterium]|nr:hypothetical protein [Gemmatimonadota bacterium]